VATPKLCSFLRINIAKTVFERSYGCDCNTIIMDWLVTQISFALILLDMFQKHIGINS
jgi:hypothetical protein